MRSRRRVWIKGYPKYSILREAVIGQGRTAALVTRGTIFDAHSHVTGTDGLALDSLPGRGVLGPGPGRNMFETMREGQQGRALRGGGEFYILRRSAIFQFDKIPGLGSVAFYGNRALKH